MCFIKWSIKMRNTLTVIHPELFPAPILFGGPSRINRSLYLRRGKTNIGGIVFPTAFTANSTVTKVPRSADTMAPTCLTPFAATIFFGFNTVVTPVSSKFHILDGSKLCLDMTSPSLLKNALTLYRLKDDAPPALVASGDLMDKDGFLFRKPVN